MKKTISIPIITAIALSCVFALRHHKNYAKELEASNAAAEISAIQKNKTQMPQQSLSASEGMSRASALNRVYLRLHLADPQIEIDSKALLEIGKCLRSSSQDLRASCESMGVYMLGDWVLNRPASDWHKSTEVDAFFRLYKSIKSSALNRYLSRMQPSLEKQYLSQI